MNRTSFKDWKAAHESRFDTHNLGTMGVTTSVERTRRHVAETLEGLLTEGDIRADMTVADLIRYLRQPIQRSQLPPQ